MDKMINSSKFGNYRNKINELIIEVSKLIDIIYPIGSLYWSSKNTNPSELFGGEWEQITDKFIYAAGSKIVNTIGGEETHKLTSAEMPSHTHGPGTLSGYYKVRDSDDSGNTVWGGEGFAYSAYDINGASGSVVINSGTTASTGSSGAHNNMPPYIVKYCWERIS